MMEVETLLRVSAILIAGALLLSTVDYSAAWTRVSKLFTRKPKTIIDVEVEDTVSFLEIVQSWHVLRSQCEEYGLKEAVEKVDEVFPLLNTEDV
tara:strand:- start:469 stop:750 length:282 start_codon:yes stop_codon:yes gene_type:complete